jgi:hypothetical protein
MHRPGKLAVVAVRTSPIIQDHTAIRRAAGWPKNELAAARGNTVGHRILLDIYIRITGTLRFKCNDIREIDHTCCYQRVGCNHGAGHECDCRGKRFH